MEDKQINEFQILRSFTCSLFHHCSLFNVTSYVSKPSGEQNRYISSIIRRTVDVFSVRV